MLGDASGALGALERSEAAIEASEEADRVRPIVSFFDRARLAGEQGLCYVRLRRFDDARAASTPASPGSTPPPRSALVSSQDLLLSTFGRGRSSRPAGRPAKHCASPPGSGRH
jgi:hypothetical protein